MPAKIYLKIFFRSHFVSLEQVMEQPAALSSEHREVLETVLALPQKYRDVVYLHYYEDYTAPRLAGFLEKM